MFDPNIDVSICCITYNQEKYIRQCLDSILNQRTNFKYEIIINDDASTDKTPDILKEYKEKHGDTIRMILQEENQYSQGIEILRDIVFHHVQGKYIAFCEGDDYWIDPDKLQKQFDIMEANAQASWCTHYVQCVNEDGSEIMGLTLPSVQQRLIEGHVFSSSETIAFLIENGIQMTSYFVRTSMFNGFYTTPPKFVMDAPVEDEAIVRYCASAGEMVFIPEVLSCYRMLSKGSWTSMNADGKMVNHYRKMIEMIKLFDEHTRKMYSEHIEKDILDKEWKLALSARDYRTLLAKRFVQKRKKLSYKSRLGIMVKAILYR